MSPLAPSLRPPRPGDRKHRATAGRAMVSLALSGFAATCAAEVDISQLPPPAHGPVDFARDIRPILENACLRCHGPERPKSGYRLDNRADALKGGAIGTAIILGDSGKSPLIHYVARLIEDLEMPPVGKGEPLTSEQVALLRAWVDQGAPYSADAETAPRLSLLTASPVVGWVGVTGNERKFREHNWIKDGFAGGLQEFTWQETLQDGTRFSADGRALGGNEDYRLRLSLERPGQGFVRAGFTQFRRWYDDAGGWYAPFTTSPFRLGEDLHTDTTRAWFDVGLDRPGWPRLQVGYEYQQRDGTKAITQWGPVSDFGTGETAAIYPAAKSFDETVHLIKADLAHTLLGVRVEDSFQLEFYDRTSNRRVADAASASGSGPDVITRFQDAADHRRLANTFRLERLVREGVLLTGGYRYADLDGGAGFSMETFLPSDPALGPFVGDVATDIVLRQQSHVANGNAQLGPWANFTLTAGAQAEWLRQQGFGRATISGFASPFESSLDRQTVQELATLRYTGLPFTVVYAEARLEQQAIGQFEDRRIDDGFDDDRDFLRDTDATVDGFDARAGVTISPWQRVALSAGYRYRDRSVDYDHRADTDGSPTPGNGYPAFIRAHDFTGEEVETKLVFRANRWLKTTLKFQVVASESYTDTPSVIAQGTGDVFTGGRWQSGNYDAHVISFSATVAPWRRLVLTPLVSYAPSRLSTAGAEAVGLPEYAGDIVSVICGASFVLDSRTDLTASYGFSTANFARAASTDHLPLGIEYDRHALTAGLRRRFTDRVSGTLDYAFFAYSEPTSGGAADYTAHGVFAGVSVRFK